MKRPGSSGSLHHRAGEGGLVPQEDKAEVRGVESFHSLVEDQEEEETMTTGDEGTAVVQLSESSTRKKRRLCVEQVKALEKNFEVENKLEPEKKEKLAQELGLQPRQVAIWFQNRRARRKTKQLERDYGVLKGNYDTLRSNYDGLAHDKESLLAEIKELKSKLARESGYRSINQEPVAEQTPQKTKAKICTSTTVNATADCGVDERDGEDAPPLIYKDGSSDSDSSAILNDFSSPPRLVSHGHIHLLDEFTRMNCTSSSTSSPFQHDDRRNSAFSCYRYNQQEEEQGIVLRMEESQIEPCGSFFSDKPTPPLPSIAPITGVDDAWWWQT